jgi:hypothetical protein
MSDGPHRSLPMRLAWKKVAERADMASCPQAQVEEAVCPALAADWHGEIPDKLLPELRAALCVEATGVLFPDQTERDLDTLRSKATSPLAGLVIDYTRQAVTEGLRGEAALNFAVSSALQERALCGLRQVAEHYHRKVGFERTENVAGRLGAALGAASIDRLARDLMGGQPSPMSRAPAKRDGIDEGVPL